MSSSVLNWCQKTSATSAHGDDLDSGMATVNRKKEKESAVQNLPSLQLRLFVSNFHHFKAVGEEITGTASSEFLHN